MKDTEALLAEYRDLAPRAEQYAKTMTEQVSQLLGASATSLGLPIQYRVKTWQSILGKLERKAIELENVTELPDLVGLRLIMLFSRDVTRACELLSKTFDVLEVEDTSNRLADTEFGYQSRHYLVKLPDSWLPIPSFQRFGDLQAEIQIRTLAQHIWAAASHQLQYKRESNIPPPLRRSIHRVSALLETVDLEFERLLGQRETYVEELEPDLERQELNVDLLAKILDSRLPGKNKEDPEDYAELLEDLLAFKISDSGALNGLIDKYLEKALQEDNVEVGKRLDTREYVGTSRGRITYGAFFTHVGLAREMLRAKFGQEFWQYMVRRRVSSGPG